MRRSHLGVPVLGDDHHIKQTPELRRRVHQVVYERHKAVGSLDRHCMAQRASMKKVYRGATQCCTTGRSPACKTEPALAPRKPTWTVVHEISLHVHHDERRVGPHASTMAQNRHRGAQPRQGPHGPVPH